MNKQFIYFFLLTCLLCQGQDCELKVNEIYSKIIGSIGNNFPAPPKLIISEKKRAVAYLNREGITIETAVIDLFCERKILKTK